MRDTAYASARLYTPLDACDLRPFFRNPLFRGDVSRNRLSTDVGDHLPDRPGRHDAAIGWHAAGTAVEDRLKQRAIRPAVAPPAVDETRPHPTKRAPAVAAVAVHRAEQLRAVGGVRGVDRQRVLDVTGGRLAAAGRDVVGIADRRRNVGIRSVAGGYHTKQNYKPNIQTMPPWLVCRARSGAKSAGGRTSAGSSDRTSPDSRNQSPPMPA